MPRVSRKQQIDIILKSCQIAVMRVITVRNIPEDVYMQLRDLAKRNHRSLQQQVLVLLEQVRLQRAISPVEAAAKIRAQLKGRVLGNVVQDVRRERKR